MTTNAKATFQRIITDKAEGLLESVEDFAVLKAFPIATVSHRTGKYPIFNVDELKKNDLKLRGVASKYAQTNSDIVTDTYSCDDYGVEEAIADETKAEMGDGYEQTIADKLMVSAYRNYEIRGCAVFLADGAFDNLQTGVDSSPSTNQFLKFSVSSSNPIKIIKAQIKEIKKQLGRKPDSIFITSDVLDELLENEVILDKIGDYRDTIADLGFIAKLFGVKEIFVTEGVVNSHNSGATDQTAELIAENKMLIYWKGVGTNSVQAPSACKIILLNYGDTASQSGIGIYKRRDDSIDADILRVKQRFDMVVQLKEAGRVLKDCI